MPNETIDYLRSQYEDLNSQWNEINQLKLSELNKVLGALDSQAEHDINPYWAAGMASLRGRPFESTYSTYANIPLQRNILRQRLVNDFYSDKETELKELQKAVINRMAARDAAGSDVPFVMGVDQTQIYMGRVKQYVDELSKLGGQDMASIQAKAHEMAQNDLMNANQAGRDLTGMTSGMQTGKPQPGIVPPVVAQPIVPPGIVDKPTVLGEDNIPPVAPIEPKTTFTFTPDYLQKIQNDPKFLESEMKNLDPSSAAQVRTYLESIKKPTVSSASTYVPSPEEKKMAEKQYEEYAKEYTSDREAISSIRNMAPSIEVMKKVLQNPKVVNVGPMHEQLTQLGGFMSYIDPNSTLAQAASSTPVYFSNMMNLVRDKIKALGSGTAISNLDFIVTQKSVGDLRNTTEGNKRLLAIMELQNASLMDRLQSKVGYFESGKQGYKGYESVVKKRGTEPSHIVRRNQNTGEYYIQSKQDWLSEQAKANNTTPDKMEKYWVDQANKATAKLLSGSGIQFGGK